MIHNLKMPDGTIQSIDCKLGSGVFDCNGKEIFEGDKVKVGNKTFKVICGLGNGLCLCDYKNNCQELQGHAYLHRNKGFADDLEIVND